MAVTIEPYEDRHIAAVRRFNERLIAGGTNPEFAFAERPVPAEQAARPIHFEHFVAVEGDEVRGGYVLKHQPFRAAGEDIPAAFYHGPISEALHDRRYAMVGVQLTRHAVRQVPNSFCLGMGGWGQPLPTMLKALKWSFYLVPFHFRVLSASRFLRNIQPLKASPLKRAAAQIAAATGAGAAGIRLAQRARAGLTTRPKVESEPAPLDDFHDELWNRVRDEYALIGLRNREALEILYPPSNPRFLTIRISQNNRPLGWAVLFDTQMQNDRYFGNLRVGTIIDGLCHPNDAQALVAGATRFLEHQGVDLMISNQSHQSWGSALQKAGFLEGPSNFLFAAAPTLAKRLDPFETNQLNLHLNRGDGDGPIHL